MNDEPPKAFDEFTHSGKGVQPVRQGPFPSPMRAGLRAISRVALCIAVVAAVFIVAFHTYRSLGGRPVELPWAPKSAVPLVAIGISYLTLIFTVDRTPAQRLLGFLVGLAFILWGVEQYLPDPALVAWIDDLVVFLFVLDLGIVIRENLVRSREDQAP
jgi:hypothetical protein